MRERDAVRDAVVRPEYERAARTVPLREVHVPERLVVVERRGDQFWIVDLGSTNGTLVNGEPIQEKELNHGDRVTIGQNSVQFSFIGS